jgi:hypothetical protein
MGIVECISAGISGKVKVPPECRTCLDQCRTRRQIGDCENECTIISNVDVGGSVAGSTCKVLMFF